MVNFLYWCLAVLLAIVAVVTIVGTAGLLIAITEVFLGKLGVLSLFATAAIVATTFFIRYIIIEVNKE